MSEEEEERKEKKGVMRIMLTYLVGELGGEMRKVKEKGTKEKENLLLALLLLGSWLGERVGGWKEKRRTDNIFLHSLSCSSSTRLPHGSHQLGQALSSAARSEQEASKQAGLKQPTDEKPTFFPHFIFSRFFLLRCRCCSCPLISCS